MKKTKLLDNLAEITRNIRLDFSNFMVSYSDQGNIIDIPLNKIEYIKKKSQDIQTKIFIVEITKSIFRRRAPRQR